MSPSCKFFRIPDSVNNLRILKNLIYNCDHNKPFWKIVIEYLKFWAIVSEWFENPVFPCIWQNLILILIELTQQKKTDKKINYWCIFRCKFEYITELFNLILQTKMLYFHKQNVNCVLREWETGIVVTTSRDAWAYTCTSWGEGCSNFDSWSIFVNNSFYI